MSTHTTDARQAAMNKARRLAALAERSDSPHEAALAARRLRDLLYHHGIDAAELGPEHSNTPTYAEAAESVHMSRIEKHISIIGIAVAMMTDTEMVTTHYRNWQNVAGQRHVAYGFAGLAQNVAAAVELNTYFLDCAHRWYAIRSATIRATRRLEYLQGVAHGIHTACVLDKAQHRAEEETAGSSTALMVLSAKAAARSFVSQQNIPTYSVKTRETVGAAFVLGVSDGRRVGARKPAAELR